MITSDKYKSRFYILVAFGVLFLVGVGANVLVPYYQTKSDSAAKEKMRYHLSALMDAINDYAASHPEHAFPSDLNAISNLDAWVVDRIVYFPILSGKVQDDSIIGEVVLLEKIGHYRFKSGGYCMKFGGAIAEWCTLKDYERIAASKGVSLDSLKQEELQKKD